MTAMNARAPLALALVTALLAAACAAPGTPPPRSSTNPTPRVRCLSDPHDTTQRPLFFLFCVESP
jgi:hypothetical protein